KPRAGSGALTAGLAGAYVVTEVAHEAFDSPEWLRKTTDAGLLGTAVALTPPSTLLPSLAPGLGGAMMVGEASRTLTDATEWSPLVDTTVETTASIGGFYAGVSVTSAGTAIVCTELGIEVASLSGMLVGTGVGVGVGLALLGGYALFRHYNKQNAFEAWREDFLGKIPEFFESPNNPNLIHEIRTKFFSIESAIANMGGSIDTADELAQLQVIRDQLQAEKSQPEEKQPATLALAFMGDYLYERYFKKMKVGGEVSAQKLTAINLLRDIRFPGFSGMCARVQSILTTGSETRANRDQTLSQLRTLTEQASGFEKLMFQKCGITLVEDYINPWLKKAYEHETTKQEGEQQLTQTQKNDQAIDFITMHASLCELNDYIRDPFAFEEQARQEQQFYQQTHTRIESRSDPQSIETFRQNVAEVLARNNPDDVRLFIHSLGLPYSQEQMLIDLCDFLKPDELREAVVTASVDQGQHIRTTQLSQQPRIEKPDEAKLQAFDDYAEATYNTLRAQHRENPWGPVGEHFTDTFRVNFLHELDLKFLEIDRTYSSQQPDSAATWIKLHMLKMWMSDVVLYLEEQGFEEADLSLDPEDLEKWSRTYGQLETIEKLIDSFEQTGDLELLGSPRSQKDDCIFKLMLDVGRAMQ
ncbi:MAG TPA: hypothetical protein VJC18_04675, partial [bacterium]|nr:hypothetical protein [bacterium]